MPGNCEDTVFFSNESTILLDGSGAHSTGMDEVTARPTSRWPSSHILLSPTQRRLIVTPRPRLPVSLTGASRPFPLSRQSRERSLDYLLRYYLDRFNLRLLMLEGNTLDMKETLQIMGNQQQELSTQLEQVQGLIASGQVADKVEVLTRNYSAMESRLNRLEDRLEILIDGFTALAQEINKIKRTRHISRSTHESRGLPPSLVIPKLTTTSRAPTKPHRKTTAFSRVLLPISVTRVPVPKSIPTPATRRSNPRTPSKPEERTKAQKRGKETDPSPVKRERKTANSSKKEQSKSSTSKVQQTTKKKTTTTTSVTAVGSQSRTQRQKPRAPRKEASGKVHRITGTQGTKAASTKLQGRELQTATRFQVEPPSHRKKSPVKEEKNHSATSGTEQAKRKHQSAVKSPSQTKNGHQSVSKTLSQSKKQHQSDAKPSSQSKKPHQSDAKPPSQSKKQHQSAAKPPSQSKKDPLITKVPHQSKVRYKSADMAQSQTKKEPKIGLKSSKQTKRENPLTARPSSRTKKEHKSATRASSQTQKSHKSTVKSSSQSKKEPQSGAQAAKQKKIQGQPASRGSSQTKKKKQTAFKSSSQNKREGSRHSKRTNEDDKAGGLETGRVPTELVIRKPSHKNGKAEKSYQLDSPLQNGPSESKHKTSPRESTPKSPSSHNPLKESDTKVKLSPNNRQHSQPQSSALDLLSILQGHHKGNKKDASNVELHIVLGRLAVPIKILPDY